MGIAFFRNLFGRRRPSDMPLQPETPAIPQPEKEEQPKTPWQHLVAKEIAQGNITEADRELLHEVDLPDVLNCEAIVENLKKKVAAGYLIPKISADRLERNKDFENFLLKKFDKRTFKILERNGLMDQVVDTERQAVTRPALVFAIGKGEEPQRFGVECKWLAQNHEQGFVCSSKTVLARAKVFEREMNIPVFIVAASGGTPALPEHLYVIPVRDIQSNYVSSEQMIHYEKDLDEPFRFDRQNLELY